MSVPRHGVHCRTYTFLTKCSRCGDQVFFFSCTCGSRVFFDQLGSPWPEHDCGFSRSDQRWAQERPKRKLNDGGICVEISEGVTAIRRGESGGRSWDIDPEVAEIARQEAKSRESDPIQSVPPGENWEVDIIGVVRELDRRVDAYQRLKLPQTALSKSFLGDLGSGLWGRVTIHVLDSVIYSYSAWIPASLLSADGLKLGVTVSVTLQRLDVFGKAREWVCRHFRVE